MRRNSFDAMLAVIGLLVTALVGVAAGIMGAWTASDYLT